MQPKWDYNWGQAQAYGFPSLNSSNRHSFGLFPDAHFPSPSMAHMLVTECQCALLCWELLLKHKEMPTAAREGSANTGSLCGGVYGPDNNELCPVCECALIAMLQLVHGNHKDRFCMWRCFSIQDVNWLLKLFLTE